MLLLPRPHVFQELLAAQRVARRLLRLHQLLLNDHLAMRTAETRKKHSLNNNRSLRSQANHLTNTIVTLAHRPVSPYLCRDAGVVGPWQPKARTTAHAIPPHQNVLRVSTDDH